MPAKVELLGNHDEKNDEALRRFGVQAFLGGVRNWLRGSDRGSIDLDTSTRLFIAGFSAFAVLFVWDSFGRPDVIGGLTGVKERGIGGTASGIVSGAGSKVGEQLGKAGQGAWEWLITPSQESPKTSLTQPSWEGQACDSQNRRKYIVTGTKSLSRRFDTLAIQLGVPKGQLLKLNPGIKFPEGELPVGFEFCY